MAHKVFICHSSKDKHIAAAACSALEARRIACWMAPRDILAGDEWGAAIVDALDECQIVLLIFSTHANDSPQVRKEVERGISKQKIIVPFRIEDVLPSRAMEYALMNMHWLDAVDPPMEARLNDLCDSIIARLVHTDGDGKPLWQVAAPDMQERHEPQTAEVDQVRTCPVCGAEYPAKNLRCAQEGAVLSAPHARGVKVAVDMRPAKISLLARPKQDLGSLNALDPTSSIVVEINGAKYEMSWGRRVFEVRPGACKVFVATRGPFSGAVKSGSEMNLNLLPGDISYIRYTGGWYRRLLGSPLDGTLEPDPTMNTGTTVVTAAPGGAATKACTAGCGTWMPMAGSFCPECGARQS